MSRLILASGSARRRELLAELGLDFEVITSDVPEDVPDGIAPDETVKLLASRKLAAVAALPELDKNDIIIAADTVVFCEGEIFGKPSDAAAAARMIRAMSGRRHQVWTGVAAGYAHAPERSLVCATECTNVYFRTISEAEIGRYVADENVYDKAGAYGIQEAARFFVERLEGDYLNVVGLPVCRLGKLLSENFGFDIWMGRQK